MVSIVLKVLFAPLRVVGAKTLYFRAARDTAIKAFQCFASRTQVKLGAACARELEPRTQRRYMYEVTKVTY